MLGAFFGGAGREGGRRNKRRESMSGAQDRKTKLYKTPFWIAKYLEGVQRVIP